LSKKAPFINIYCFGVKAKLRSRYRGHLSPDPCLLERSGNPDIGAEFDFAPADLVFVEKLQKGEIAIQSQS